MAPLHPPAQQQQRQQKSLSTMSPLDPYVPELTHLRHNPLHNLGCCYPSLTWQTTKCYFLQPSKQLRPLLAASAQTDTRSCGTQRRWGTRQATVARGRVEWSTMLDHTASFSAGFQPCTPLGSHADVTLFSPWQFPPIALFRQQCHNIRISFFIHEHSRIVILIISHSHGLAEWPQQQQPLSLSFLFDHYATLAIRSHWSLLTLNLAGSTGCECW